MGAIPVPQCSAATRGPQRAMAIVSCPVFVAVGGMLRDEA